ncbi:Maf family protein [Thiomicrorhabdus sp. zzn3]|uniref:Maf family protein n=1 Tax=Thiomicrorhabdus sp. zzn3 TaxID=3039775 RepID=UPI0024373EBE|nr:Maf family protein [Thiomicrorhabdus sp. zzn3]MDG6779017.1 Maf family protein [Thiomicrorhabdus sp. zzn3]
MEAEREAKKLLYLASGSPRRQELMRQLNLNFEVIEAPVEEVALPNESPESYVRRIAIEKALAGFNKVAGKQIWVVGGDTAVVLGDKVFGKPRSEADAHAMLRRLSGATHRVLSGVAVVYDGEVFSRLNQTDVTFRALEDAEIHEYWLSGEPQGKAGSYAIQGLGARFIERIEGSYSGVMGLALYELDQLLRESAYTKE